MFVPREFQPGSDTFDARFRFVGPSPAAREDDPGWTPPDEPVLFVALSTAFNDRPDFYRSRLEVFDEARAGRRRRGAAVASTTWARCPTTSTSGPWFPQPAVLRHARAFVSHAGMGPTMEALYYGVPPVCVPQMLEQEVNAGRVAELGLGVLSAASTDRGSCVPPSPPRRPTRSTRRSTGCGPPSAAGGAVAAADAIEAHWAPAPSLSPASPRRPRRRRP